MKEKKLITVGEYLTRRLEQIGIRHIFGVPGDYVLNFFTYLEESKMEIICTCNELNAGYAADAYARLNGIGAVSVTYGVGGFSLFNAIAGAFSESVPVIVISGAPAAVKKKKRPLLHHTSGNLELQSDMYKNITVYSVILSLENAAEEIDQAIRECIKNKKPVYIEVPQDIVSRKIEDAGELEIGITSESDEKALNEAVQEAISLISTAKNPLVLAGIEIHRFGLQKEFSALLDQTGFLFGTTPLSKSVLSEQHPQFIGVYAGEIGNQEAEQIVDESDLVVGLGVLETDMNLGLGTAKPIAIEAYASMVRINEHFYYQVRLQDFLERLEKELPKRIAKRTFKQPVREEQKPFDVHPDEQVTIERFYKRISRFIDDRHVVIADAGDSFFNILQLYLPEHAFFIGQAFYLSIGFSVPATLGVGLALPEKRPMLFVGDGAFQMTAQVISTIAKHKLNPIIFLMNNAGYTVERCIQDGEFNDIQAWNYHKLPEVFCDENSWGCLVKTEGNLEEALTKANQREKDLAFIEVQLDMWDCSETLKKIGAGLR